MVGTMLASSCTGGKGALGGASPGSRRGAPGHVPDLATVDLSNEAHASAYAALPPLWASIQLAAGSQWRRSRDLAAELESQWRTAGLLPGVPRGVRSITQAGGGGGQRRARPVRPGRACRVHRRQGQHRGDAQALAASSPPIASWSTPSALFGRPRRPACRTPTTRAGPGRPSSPRPSGFLAQWTTATSGALVPVYGRLSRQASAGRHRRGCARPQPCGKHHAAASSASAGCLVRSSYAGPRNLALDSRRPDLDRYPELQRPGTAASS